MADTASGETQSYSPQKGTLYCYDFNVELRCEVKLPLNGAVYDITDFMLGGRSYLVVGINALVRIYMIERESDTVEKIAEVESQIITYKLKVVKPRFVQRRKDHVKILVADIMKSLTVYTFARYPDSNDGERFKLDARDTNGLWCIEMADVPETKRPDDDDADMDDDA